MATFFVKSDGRRLCPTSRAGQIQIEKYTRGVFLKATVVTPRSVPQHRLFWAFATLVAEALNDGPTGKTWDQDDVVRLMKIGAGHVDMMPLNRQDAKRLGVTHFAMPKSISFAKMDGDKFGRFMTAAFEYIRDAIGPWIEQSDHWRDIEIILTESGLIGSDNQKEEINE